MTEEQVDFELRQMAGSRAAAEQLKASLRKLKDGSAGPELAEMANEVLEGRTTLHQVARSSAYEESMTGLFQRFHEWNASLSDEEREKLVKEAEDQLGPEDGLA